MQDRYAIVDLETTGGVAKLEKIIEIGIVLHDGEKILDTYQSLVYPERSIPPFITKITGISDDMLVDAPKFYEIAKDIVEWTDGAIFVAHNVRFDYSFLRHEFAALGYTFSKRQLDTIRLCREVFPGLKSYSLGNLIKHFGIEVNDRHRALDDALATAKLLEIILQERQSKAELKLLVNKGVKQSKLPGNITLDKLHSLPEECGVYYFINQFEDIIYIGKSTNIRKRVMQHFANMKEKGSVIHQRAHDIRFEITGSELIALLKEAEEIKAYAPSINKALRRKSFPYVLHYVYDKNGIIRFETKKVSKKQKETLNIINEYPNTRSAKASLKGLMHTAELCQCANSGKNGLGACIDYQLEKCFGVARGEEPIEAYNERAETYIDMYKTDFQDDFILIEPGRTMQEHGLILVKDGLYQGYGYVDKEIGINNKNALLDFIEIHETGEIYNRILQRHISSLDDMNVIFLNPDRIKAG